MLTIQDLENIFSYHTPTEENKKRHEQVNELFVQLAKDLFDIMPEGKGKTKAYNKLQEARHSVNACISLDGKY